MAANKEPDFDIRVVLSIRQFREISGLPVFLLNQLPENSEIKEVVEGINESYEGFKEYIKNDTKTFDHSLVLLFLTHLAGTCRLSPPDAPTEHELRDCVSVQFSNWERHLIAIAKLTDNADSPLKKKNGYKPYPMNKVLDASMRRIAQIQEIWMHDYTTEEAAQLAEVAKKNAEKQQ